MALTPYLMPKRECFAVTVPDGALADPYLRRLKRTYLLAMLALTAIATVACAAALTLDPEHAFVAALIAAALVLCVGGYGLMLYFRAKVQRYKKAQGWVAEGRRSVGFVGDEPFPKPLSLTWDLLYVPVILITLAMGVAGYPAMPDKVPLHMGFYGSLCAGDCGVHCGVASACVGDRANEAVHPGAVGYRAKSGKLKAKAKRGCHERLRATVGAHRARHPAGVRQPLGGARAGHDALAQIT